ncbi:MAG: TasA family protein [Syntrophomonas sp.]
MKIITHAKKNVNRRIGLIVVSLVLSLGLIGSAVAMYSDTLTANHNVNTGGLNVQFVNGSTTTQSLDCNLLVGETANKEFYLINKGTVPVNFKDDSATSLIVGSAQVTIQWPTGANATLDPEAQMRVPVEIVALSAGTYQFNVNITATPWNGYTEQWKVNNLQLQGSVVVTEPSPPPAAGGGS